MTKIIIAADLGATKCHAGIIEYQASTQALNCIKQYTTKLTETSSLADLIQQIESGLDCAIPDADAICIGGAGQYDGQFLRLEGVYPYTMPFAHLAKQQQWPAYAVIHDYAPIVCATFTTYMNEVGNVKRLNTCPIQPQGRRVALGIGTGLGLKDGVLLPNGDFWLGKNEMGHIGITTPPLAEPADLQRHAALIEFLQSKQSNYPVTFEKILSGAGTVRLHQFFYPNDDALTPEQVGMKMRSGEVPEMLAAFAWYVGLLVGTVELTFMPEGGIWLTGGVAINHVEIFDRPEFYAGIKASPSYLLERAHYPLGVLCNQDHALMGGAYYAAKRLLPVAQQI